MKKNKSTKTKFIKFQIKKLLKKIKYSKKSLLKKERFLENKLILEKIVKNSNKDRF